MFQKDVLMVPLAEPSLCVPPGSVEPDDKKRQTGSDSLNVFSERLTGLFSAMGICPDIWTVGHSAGLLASRVPTEILGGPGSAKVPVVVMERAIDLSTCLLHSGSSLEAVVDTLPRSGCCDVQIPTDPSADISGLEAVADSAICGSLAHPDDKSAQYSIDMSVTSKLPHTYSTAISFVVTAPISLSLALIKKITTQKITSITACRTESSSNLCPKR